jgi:hypothetical protein
MGLVLVQGTGLLDRCFEIKGKKGLRIFLSGGKKVPVIGANKREYYLWQFPVAIWDYFAIRRWERENKLIEKNGGIETYQIGAQKVAFTPHHWSVYFREWNGQWKRYYLPNFDLKGKTVLDAGEDVAKRFYFTWRTEPRK